jgi:hypothetical protein
MPRCSVVQWIRAATALVALLGAGPLALAGGGHGHGGHAGGSGHASGGASFAGHAMAGHGGHIVTSPGVLHPGRNDRRFHGVRGGHAGGWWLAAGGAYVYAPVYPVYPAYAQGAVIVEPAYAYYCNALQGYYPEVQTCPEPWLIVVPGGE